MTEPLSREEREVIREAAVRGGTFAPVWIYRYELSLVAVEDQAETLAQEVACLEAEKATLEAHAERLRSVAAGWVEHNEKALTQLQRAEAALREIADVAYRPEGSAVERVEIIQTITDAAFAAQEARDD